LARIWELHPKTVYQWIREGRLPSVRTPGAQYRVRSDDARAYCAKFGLPMPSSIASSAGRVALLGKASASQRAIVKACRARGTTVRLWANAVEGLMGVALDAPDVLGLDADLTDVTVNAAVRALRKTLRTAQLPVVVYDATPQTGLRKRRGVLAIAPRGDADAAVRAVLELLDASPRA
jgi:excisionase family DNA binding protein